MTSLRIEPLIIPSAHLDGENPLPPLVPSATASAAGDRHRYAFENDAYVTPAEQSVLPNLLQDQYDRALEPRSCKTAVLENDFLRAQFLLEAGGRLWSLIDKTATAKNPAGTELLFRNPVFRPANLAVRDAWFAGGIEWNVSLIGHSPFTCAPLFAASLKTPEGDPVLRLYEWDRIRCLPWQIDFFLPEKSKFLFTRMRIINPWPRSLPMYWWSNIAIPEARDARILGPADEAARHAYDGALIQHPLPIAEDMDVTYPARRPYVRDLYFRIPDDRRRWISSIDANGYGLVETSTDLLRGRKVFNWGSSAGGRRWQEYLSLPGNAYIEIQAGLAPTQSEYLRMPPNSTYEWLEAYGPIQVDPARAHAADWQSACAEVESQIENALPRAAMNRLLESTQNLPDVPPEKTLSTGSGWGALERRRREKSGEPLTAPYALPFPDSSLTAEQTPWINLLETGVLPEPSPKNPPLSPIVQPEWRTLLEKSLAAGKSDHWLSYCQLGIMQFAAGEREQAVKSWETSVASTPNAWAYRNLAVAAQANGNSDQAANLLEKAWDLQPKSLPITLEFGRALAAAGRSADLAKFIAALPKDMQAHGRMQLLKAQAALALGDFPTVAAFFASEIEINNIREQEISLTTLWFNYHARRLAAAEKIPIDEALIARARAENPPPKWIDFRASPNQ